jgi:hypothetical protein
LFSGITRSREFLVLRNHLFSGITRSQDPPRSQDPLVLQNFLFSRITYSPECLVPKNHSFSGITYSQESLEFLPGVVAFLLTVHSVCAHFRCQILQPANQVLPALPSLISHLAPPAFGQSLAATCTRTRTFSLSVARSRRAHLLSCSHPHPLAPSVLFWLAQQGANFMHSLAPRHITLTPLHLTVNQLQATVDLTDGRVVWVGLALRLGEIEHAETRNGGITVEWPDRSNVHKGPHC